MKSGNFNLETFLMQELSRSKHRLPRLLPSIGQRKRIRESNRDRRAAKAQSTGFPLLRAQPAAPTQLILGTLRLLCLRNIHVYIFGVGHGVFEVMGA